MFGVTWVYEPTFSSEYFIQSLQRLDVSDKNLTTKLR